MPRMLKTVYAGVEWENPIHHTPSRVMLELMCAMGALAIILTVIIGVVSALKP